MRKASKAHRHSKRNAFTLMEVLLVLAIMGTIMSMVVPKLLGRQKHANVDSTRLSLRGVEQALSMYALDHGGRYPATKDGLEALIQAPVQKDSRWRGPYLDKLPRDAWGEKILYQFPGRRNPKGFDVISSGPDGIPDTEDDVFAEDSEA